MSPYRFSSPISCFTEKWKAEVTQLVMERAGGPALASAPSVHITPAVRLLVRIQLHLWPLVPAQPVGRKSLLWDHVLPSRSQQWWRRFPQVSPHPASHHFQPPLHPRLTRCRSPDILQVAHWHLFSSSGGKNVAQRSWFQDGGPASVGNLCRRFPFGEARFFKVINDWIPGC